MDPTHVVLPRRAMLKGDITQTTFIALQVQVNCLHVIVELRKEELVAKRACPSLSIMLGVP